jgi:SAM-dependent methyltransferase
MYTLSMTGVTVQSFFDLYGDIPLRELFADWLRWPLDSEDGNWLNFPPSAFLEWSRDFPRHPFDGIPPAPHQKIPPSFLLSQTHRIWLSAKLIIDHGNYEGFLADFGSFPFSVPLVLRDYFAYRGPITVTAIQPLSGESKAILDLYGIQVEMLDLDPYVIDRSRAEQPPRSLPLNDESVDMVTMFHVIEHLYHPMSALSEARRILRKGGRLVITTDNAMMLQTLQNYVSNVGYIFEPVNSTCAMSVHDWRGHVRFFTAADLETMTQSAGFSVAKVGYEEIFYDVFHEAYFDDPKPYMPGWYKRVLKEHRQFANDVFLIATKN